MYTIQFKQTVVTAMKYVDWFHQNVQIKKSILPRIKNETQAAGKTTLQELKSKKTN